MFDKLVEELGRLLPDFGQRLVIDSKAIDSAGKPTKKKADGRRDSDGDGGLKYICSVSAYGMTCAGKSQCRHCCKSIRIPLSLKGRLFTPIARSSYKWDQEYNYCSAVERVNSRLDVSFGFEHHFIRGLRKMRVQLSLALIVMIAMAVGQVKAGRQEGMRSLIKMPDQTVKKKAA